jgi:rhodanese-related sulfurtransferase
MAIQNWSLLMITSGGISGNSHFLGMPENEEPQFQWIIIIFPPKMTTLVISCQSLRPLMAASEVLHS